MTSSFLEARRVVQRNNRESKPRGFSCEAVSDRSRPRGVVIPQRHHAALDQPQSSPMIASDKLRDPECSLPPCPRVVEHSSEPLPLRSRQGQRSFCCSDYSNWSDIGPRSNGPRLGGWNNIAAYSIFICLVGSIPAASLNAVVLSRFARRGADEAVVSAISGGTIGFLVA